MPDSTNPTPDAVALAFRQMAEADPETHPSCWDCGATYRNPDSIGSIDHAPDCPWLRRKQARERAEQKVREIIQPLEQIASRATWECPESQSLASDAQDALAALKGAHTK